MTDKTYPIPRGWRRVVRGNVKTGDKAWDYHEKRFTPMENIGDPARWFMCVIRRVKGGAG